MVCFKVDSLFKIVGVVLIVVKVIRDRYVYGWVDFEDVVYGFVFFIDCKFGVYLFE